MTFSNDIICITKLSVIRYRAVKVVRKADAAVIIVSIYFGLLWSIN